MLLFATLQSVHAQGPKPSIRNTTVKTTSGNLYIIGQQATMITTDSAIDPIDSIVLNPTEAGVVEVTVTGLNQLTGDAVTGVKILRYKNAAGTLTLGSATDVLASTTDTGLGSATWSITSVNNNLYVNVKGKNTISVKWIVNVRRTFREAL